MNIVLNGAQHSTTANMTLAMLIEELGYAGKKIAVEHNLVIIPRSQYAIVTLAENDNIEIVHAIGGG